MSRMHANLPGRMDRRAPLAAEHGFGVAELIVAMLIFTVVIATVYSLLTTVTRNTPRDIEAGHAITDGQTGVATMVRELRSSRSVLETEPNVMTVIVADRQVRYDCDVAYPASPRNPASSAWHRCMRVQAAIGAALPASSTGSIVIDRVVGDLTARPVFQYTYPPPPPPPDPADPTDPYDVDEEADPIDSSTLPDQPSYVAVNIAVPASGRLEVGGYGHTYVLDGGFFLRNTRPGS